MTDEQIIEVSDHWDVEAGEMIAWLNANAP